MKWSKKAHRSMKVWFIGIIAIIVLAIIGGGFWYHNYEYQTVVYHLSDGSSVASNRHDFNSLSSAAKQVFLDPVNENALHPCGGNTIDQCIATPSIDFWPVGSEGASSSYVKMPTTNPDEIMGRIVTHVGDNLEIKTTSGRTFTIVYPIDALANFNNNYAAGYGITVSTGNEVYVNYYGSKSSSTTIATNQIMSSSLILKGNGKASPVELY
jgi:signal peptidase I